MKLLKKISLIVFLNLGLCLYSSSLHSQEDSTQLSLSLISTYIDGKVVLRWSPVDYETWNICKDTSYTLTRYEVNSDGALDENSRMTWDVAPYTEEFYRTEADHSDEALMAVGFLMYGDVQSDTNDVFALYHEARNRFAFALVVAARSRTAAEALGLRFEDPNFQKNKNYQYSISSKAEANIIPGINLVNTEKEDFYPIRLDSVVSHDGYVTLTWDKHLHDLYYSGYYIEKSDDGKSFYEISNGMFMASTSEDYKSDQYVYVDSIPNDVTHYYRIIGQTPFNFITNPSNVVAGIAKDLTPPDYPVSISANTLEDGSIYLKWKYADPLDIADVRIQHTGDMKHGFKEIQKLEPSVNEYTFKSDDFRPIDYFRIRFSDASNNHLYSRKIIVHKRDTTAPIAPSNLQGTVDTNGVVLLTWSAPPDNDVKGYYVYTSNADYHEPVIITPMPLLDTFFYDTINIRTLTEEIYFRIVAIDWKSNYSEFSLQLELKRPDIIPPSAPTFYDKIIQDGYIRLKWHESVAKDVVDYKLLRKDSTGWERLTILLSGVYDDYDVVPGQNYTYRITAIDDAGLESEYAFDYYATYFETKTIPTPNIEVLDYDKEEQELKLTWTDLGEHHEYMIYVASKVSGPYYSYKSSTAPSLSIKTNDRRLNAFKVQAVHKDGRKSHFSIPKEIQK